jgi:hypothetical protein
MRELGAQPVCSGYTITSASRPSKRHSRRAEAELYVRHASWIEAARKRVTQHTTIAQRRALASREHNLF